MATRQLSTEERDRELTEAATRLVTEHQHRPGAGWSGDELGMVPVERIRVLEGHNARQDLGDIFELTESIRSHGVLQALLVEQLADEGGQPVYGLLAGHRRLQAARMAQLAEVPCQVRRDLDAGTRTVVMLVENLRRRDLDPLEEAVGIRRLVELGLSQREVARQLGCSQGQVSKRLALLELPDQIRKTIGQPDDAGGITVADALELARLAEHPERRTRAFEQGRRGHYGGIAGMVRMELAEAEREARRAHARAELQRADVKILKEQDYYSWYSRREQPLLGCGHDHETLKLSVEQHQGEPCHAAAIDREGKVVYVCQDPSRHGDADPAASARAEKARREQEQHRLRREAGRGRRE